MVDDFESVGTLLSEADPAGRTGYDQEALAVLLVQARAGGLSHSHSAPTNSWWRRHVRSFFTGATVLVVAGGLTAGGLAVNARTNWFGTPGSESGTSEMIFLGGTDYMQVVADAAPSGLVYPARLTRVDAKTWILSRFPQGGKVDRPEAGIRGDYCLFAQGTWELMWQRALDAKDGGGQKIALDRIDAAVNCANDLGIWADDLYSLLMARQSAARAGDPEPLLRDIRINTPVEFPAILKQALGEAR